MRSANETDVYWRDVGTVDAYWQANIDLTDVVPPLDIYDRDWPIWTYAEITPPAKFVHDVDGRRGQAISSLVSGDCIISGGSLNRSLLFTGVRQRSYSHLDHAVVLPQCHIGRNVRIKNAVIDRGVHIPDGLVIGEDPELDAQRFRRTESGVCLVTKPMIDRLNYGDGLKVLSVASEVYPFIKTGGLADVAGALPLALTELGMEVKTLLPLYPEVARALPAGEGEDGSGPGGPLRRARPGSSRYRPPGSTSSSSTRPISTTGRAALM